MLYFRTVTEQPAPISLIGTLLQRHEDLLQRLAFDLRLQTITAESAAAVLRSRVWAKIDRQLRGKQLRLVDLQMSAGRTSKVVFRYHQGVNQDASQPVEIALWEPSKKAQTLERRRQEEDPGYNPEVYTYKRKVCAVG